MGFHASAVLPTLPPSVERDWLGDEIAELSAHLDAATAPVGAGRRHRRFRGNVAATQL